MMPSTAFVLGLAEGRTSARETIGRVAAGAVAKKILKKQFGVDVLACVSQVKHISAEINPDKFTLKQVEANIIRCPHKATAEKMIRLIERVRKQGDSVGGIITGVARGVPVGWGEPVFDRLEAIWLRRCSVCRRPRRLISGRVLRASPCRAANTMTCFECAVARCVQ